MGLLIILKCRSILRSGGASLANALFRLSLRYRCRYRSLFCRSVQWTDILAKSFSFYLELTVASIPRTENLHFMSADLTSGTIYLLISDWLTLMQLFDERYRAIFLKLLLQHTYISGLLSEGQYTCLEWFCTVLVCMLVACATENCWQFTA